MKFAVEMQDHPIAGYAKVHVAGCKDLKDPENFESDPTQAAIDDAVEALTGWEPGFALSPCAKKLVKS